MFKAVQLRTRKKHQKVVVKDSISRFVGNDADTATVITKHFESQFCGNATASITFKMGPSPSITQSHHLSSVTVSNN